MRAAAKRLILARRMATSMLLDLRYGGLLRGVVETRFGDQGATHTINTPYDVLAASFRPGEIRAGDVLVDVGCGKGRVINWWLRSGFRNRIIGIELDPEVAAKTRRRLRRHQNVSIICGDAIDELPADGSVYYLYNPFKAPVVRAFRDRLAEMSAGEVRIYYYHPRHIDLFENDQRWTVSDRRLVNRASPAIDLAVIRLASRAEGGRHEAEPG
jgi:SAM-dependent methyltransferase